jgi:alpha-beta hydrolase superfamily lysophospholipase
MAQSAAPATSLQRGEEFFYSKDGSRLFLGWSLPLAPKAAVLVVHGYGDHAGRYAHVVEALAGADYATYAMDYRGHGQAAGRRGYCANFSEFLEDLTAGIANVKARHPGLPFFLVGHSHGALMIAELLTSGGAPEGISGVAFSSPYFALAITPSWFQLFQAKAVGKLVPFLPVKNPLEVGQLSRDPQWVESTRKDPLYGRVVTPKWFTESTRVQAALLARAGRLTLPLLVMQGGGDTVARPSGAKEFFDRAGSADKRFTDYPEYFHEIFNDLGREKPIGELVSWLDARASKGA